MRTYLSTMVLSLEIQEWGGLSPVTVATVFFTLLLNPVRVWGAGGAEGAPSNLFVTVMALIVAERVIA